MYRFKGLLAAEILKNDPSLTAVLHKSHVEAEMLPVQLIGWMHAMKNTK